MALPESSVSVVCATVAEFVNTGIGAPANHITVAIGPPGEVGNSYEGHRVNLFFYRFEPSGFDAGVRPGQVWRVRMFCLITAFGVLDEQVSPGENELRLLGEVMRLFRETPVMEAVEANGQVVRLQAVFIPLSEDHINQIWSTQGETYYHPSVAYEMSLGVVVPSQLSVDPPRVGALGAVARASRPARFAPFSGNMSVALAPAARVDIADPQWAPRIAFLYQGACLQSLAFDVGSQAFADLDHLDVWLAGDPAAEVELAWERWSPGSGWEPAAAPIAAHPFGVGIDPGLIPPSQDGVFPLELAKPFVLPVEDNSGQAYLQARRSFTLYPGGPTLTVRSNPLLLTLFRGA